MLAGFLAANLVVAAVAALVQLQRPASPPLIQGVLLPQGRELGQFRLLDHRNEAFTNADLRGRWHLVSYGFTTCPDICPTTLSQLVTLTRELRQTPYPDLQVLFYSVDHRRDTARQLASYVSFFDPGFIGLTHLDEADNPHLPFEKSLGIVAQLVPQLTPEAAGDPNAYQVNHGVALFLINPEGELQAVFEPDNPLPGQHSFDPQQVLLDYLAIRRYLG